MFKLLILFAVVVIATVKSNCLPPVWGWPVPHNIGHPMIHGPSFVGPQTIHHPVFPSPMMDRFAAPFSPLYGRDNIHPAFGTYPSRVPIMNRSCLPAHCGHFGPYCGLPSPYLPFYYPALYRPSEYYSHYHPGPHRYCGHH